MDYPLSKLKIPLWTVIHCSSESEAKHVLLIADYFGCSWFNGVRYIHRFEYNSFLNCYDLVSGRFGSKSYYSNLGGYSIMPAKEFISIHSEVLEYINANIDFTPFDN